MSKKNIFERGLGGLFGDAVSYYENKIRPELMTDLRPDAIKLRGAPKPLPEGPDESGAVGIRWDVAESQLRFEAEFAAFVLLWWSADPPKSKRDAKRKAMEAALAFHGQDPQNAPTAGIFDILHKEDIDE